MDKEYYIKIINDKMIGISKEIMMNQISSYYKAKEYKIPKCKYNIGDDVKLIKGTLLHGTYKNLDGLKFIKENGLMSSLFIEGRNSKYPSSVGVWNIKQDILLKDYIDLYSGGTIEYKTIEGDKIGTDVISYSKMNNLMNMIDASNCFRWHMEQTKEARFLPSLAQDKVQIGIIFNSDNEYIQELLKGDILNPNVIRDEDVKDFINENYYDTFIKYRKKKDDFFTDRESAILFGIPSNLIEGILVGREYEQYGVILDEIKSIIPNCYICNLDGKVIRD